MQQCKLLKEYQNGNYKVRIYSDGTKIRFSKDDEFHPEFPESIDLKITNRCDLRCPMCHEKSTPMGKHALLDHPFLDTLVPGCELAIGGGNPLDHPELISFLKSMKEKGIICNITVNQIHLFRYKNDIQNLIDNGLIYGLGVSVTKDLFIDEIVEFSAKNPNVVIHVIAGIISKELIEKLSNKNLKLLILGYKVIGRGKNYYPNSFDPNMEYLEKNILEISKGFKIVSFDNLAIIQLKMKHKIANYEEVYMGDDGEFTMYIDLVKKEYAVSSTSERRFKIKDNIKVMFKHVKEINPIYHVEYYLTTDEKSMLFATLKEDDTYTFYFDENNDKWVFGGLRFRDIGRPCEKVDENLAAFLTMGKFVEDYYEEYFGFKIAKEKEIKKDPVDDLVDNLIDFSREHYKYGLAEEKALNLSARELENAYNCGYYELIERYYKDINNQKYKFIYIEKIKDDYIVHLDKEILKGIKPINK